jgi:hypothetical protein
VNDRPHLAKRVSLGVLGLNLIGTLVYLLWAAQTWVAPQERGMNTTTPGDPLVWGAFVLPLFATFFLLNLIWGSLIVIYRLWRLGRLWLLVVMTWFVAIVIDVVKHH